MKILIIALKDIQGLYVNNAIYLENIQMALVMLINKNLSAYNVNKLITIYY